MFLDSWQRVCLAWAKIAFGSVWGEQMNVTWGSRLDDETKGLDVLGIRALDQSIEASLTNGITTISIRARYISIRALAAEFTMTRRHGAST